MNKTKNNKNQHTANIMGQAYQVIGSLAHAAGLLDHAEVQRALSYFSSVDYDESFLPITLGDKSGTTIK